MLVVSRFVFLIPVDFLKEIKVFLLKKKNNKKKIPHFKPWGYGGSGYTVLLPEKNDADYIILSVSVFKEVIWTKWDFSNRIKGLRTI